MINDYKLSSTTANLTCPGQCVGDATACATACIVPLYKAEEICAGITSCVRQREALGEAAAIEEVCQASMACGGFSFFESMEDDLITPTEESSISVGAKWTGTSVAYLAPENAILEVSADQRSWVVDSNGYCLGEPDAAHVADTASPSDRRLQHATSKSVPVIHR